MKTYFSPGHEPLHIVQPSVWRRTYELRSGGGVLMTMRYPKWYSSGFVVEGFEEVWEFHKPSIWRSDIDIKKQHQQLPFARYLSEKWGKGGTIELPNGGRMDYRFNFWKNSNELSTQSGVKIVSFKRLSLFKTTVVVTVEHESELLENHPWIIMLTFHIILERRQRAHGAG